MDSTDTRLKQLEGRMTHRSVESANENNLVVSILSFGVVYWLVTSVPKVINVAGSQLGIGKFIIIPLMVPILLAFTFGVVELITFLRRKEFSIYRISKQSISTEEVKILKEKYRIVREDNDIAKLVNKADFKLYADYNLLHSKNI